MFEFNPLNAALHAQVSEAARTWLPTRGRAGRAARPCAAPSNAKRATVFIRTLGGLSLTVNGATVLPKGRARDLLVELLARGGRDVSAAAVASSLWPHGETDYALGALNTTLYRMRRQPGLQGLVQLSDGRLSLRAEDCEVDRWTVEAAIDGASTLMELGAERGAGVSLEAADDTQHIEQLLALAVTLYRGPLLEQDDAESTRKARQRLRLRLANVLGRADAWFERRGAARRGWLAQVAASDPCPELRG